MPVRIRYLAPAQDGLRKHRNVAMKIIAKVEQLAFNPRGLARNVTRLKGRPESRLRVGEYRVIFLREADELVVIDVAPRGGIYD